MLAADLQIHKIGINKVKKKTKTSLCSSVHKPCNLYHDNFCLKLLFVLLHLMKKQMSEYKLTSKSEGKSS